MAEGLSVSSAKERRLRFARAFNALAMRLREPIDPDERIHDAKLELYLTALNDLPIDAVEDAALHLARTAKWFPKTSEWHEAAVESCAVRMRAIIGQARPEPWHTEHHDCNDTGWLRHDCTAESRCGRAWCRQQDDAYTHTYVEPCHCRGWNRTWQRTHQVASETEAAR